MLRVIMSIIISPHCGRSLVPLGRSGGLRALRRPSRGSPEQLCLSSYDEVNGETPVFLPHCGDSKTWAANDRLESTLEFRSLALSRTIPSSVPRLSGEKMC
jgi:hypothetical protein